MNEFVRLKTMHGEAHIIRDSIKAFSCKETTVNGKTVHRVGVTCEVGATSKTLLYDIKSYDDYVKFRTEMTLPSRPGMAIKQDTLEITGGCELFYDWLFGLSMDPSQTPAAWKVEYGWHTFILYTKSRSITGVTYRLDLVFNPECTRFSIARVADGEGHRLDLMQYNECLRAFVEDFVRPFAKRENLVYNYSGGKSGERNQ